MAGFFTGELGAVQSHLADVLTTGVKLNGKYAFKLMKFNNMNVASGDLAGFSKGNTELLVNITKAAQNGMKFGGRLVSQPGKAAKVFQAVGRLNPTEMSDLTTTYSQIMKQGIDTNRAFQNIANGGNFSKDQMTVLQAMMGNINVGKVGDSAFVGKGQMFSDFDATSAEGKKLLDVGQASAKFWSDHPFLRSLRNGWNSFISYIGKLFGTIGRWFSAAGKYLSDKFNVLKNSGLSAFFKGNTWYENGVCILVVLAITGFLCWGAYKLYQIMFKKRQMKKNATVKESYIRTINRQSFIEAKQVARFLKENTAMSKYDCNKVANFVYKKSLNRKINNLI